MKSHPLSTAGEILKREPETWGSIRPSDVHWKVVFSGVCNPGSAKHTGVQQEFMYLTECRANCPQKHSMALRKRPLKITESNH